MMDYLLSSENSWDLLKLKVCFSKTTFTMFHFFQHFAVPVKMRRLRWFHIKTEPDKEKKDNRAFQHLREEEQSAHRWRWVLYCTGVTVGAGGTWGNNSLKKPLNKRPSLLCIRSCLHAHRHGLWPHRIRQVVGPTCERRAGNPSAVGTLTSRWSLENRRVQLQHESNWDTVWTPPVQTSTAALPEGSVCLHNKGRTRQLASLAHRTCLHKVSNITPTAPTRKLLA